MADDEKKSYRPERTENILSGNGDDSIEKGERPALVPAQSSSSTNVELEDDVGELKKIQTSRTTRTERNFEPISPGDRAQLTRLASNFSVVGDGSMTRSSTRGSNLTRKDTLYGVDVGNPVLDPKSPEFDPYKWSRLLVNGKPLLATANNF